MNYKINKKSFYEMMEKIFNKLYGDDYVKYEKVTYCDTNTVINNKLYNCTIEKNVLKDSNDNDIFSDEYVIILEEKYSNDKTKTKIFNNDFFEITSEKNEIRELITPYLNIYPFLEKLPNFINIIYYIDNKEAISFNTKNTELLFEILKYSLDNNNKNPGIFQKIRTMLKHSIY